YYASAAPGSLHRVLAQGLRQKITEQGPRVVIYAAENHNHAAEILKDKVMAEIPANEQAAVAAKVGFLNTVIGKMGGVHTEAAAIQRHGLAVLTPATSRAFLMESFNRILISQVKFDDGGGAPSFRRGIDVFEEKADLLPFEEAKLFGHNATHSMASYIAMLRGVHHLADLRALPDFMAFLRAAFIEESGAALIRKYGGTDPLFTQTGYTHYADNLLERMTNPFLRDTAERVGRDPARKLGWDDRLIGTLRLARRQQVAPQRYAFGAAAGLAVMDRATLTEQTALTALVNTLWREAAPESSEYAAVLGLIEDGQHRLKHWLQAGFPDLTGIF
ncbi:MAG TPA: hypothetical protein VHO69_01120, partial [Phototrophicaceae bacterium]|nr:hypothetical protein [Phototrophicaceae bacterium]